MAEMLAETGDVSLHHADTLISEGALDVDEEREACTHASRLVLQFPLYWFAPPASLKVWLDTRCSTRRGRWPTRSRWPARPCRPSPAMPARAGASRCRRCCCGR
ncbi:NAD(P)H-dependent oxidoreductase [Jeongeupia naejangsanensis]|uniref:NAD(P)H-dependent oxidoreductase n=1 Tax=Jeongeupia naejangsanensis TaxID=613195 RepID=UPI003570EEF5